MGGIMNVRKKLGDGNIEIIGNDKIEIEKNDVVVKEYITPDLQYIENTSKMHFDGVEHLANIDVDDLTDVQLRALHNDPDIQIVKKFGTPAP